MGRICSQAGPQKSSSEGARTTPTISTFIARLFLFVGYILTRYTDSNNHIDPLLQLYPPHTGYLTMSAGKTGLKAEDRKAIGITLGNSNSSIAYLKEDNVEVIANEDGGRQGFFTRRMSDEVPGERKEGGLAG